MRKIFGKSIFLYIIIKICLITNLKLNLFTISYISFDNILLITYWYFVKD